MRLHLSLPALIQTCCLAAIAQPIPHAQTSPSAAATVDTRPLAFDIISVKPNETGTTIIGEGVMGAFTINKLTHDGFSSANTTLKSLIANTYGIREDFISGGPGWIASTRYDIEAKDTGLDAPNSPHLTKYQRNQMLQSLLADRFKLVVHPETKQDLIYELVLAKGGPRLQEAKPDGTNSDGLKSSSGILNTDLIWTKQREYTGRAVSIPSLVDLLSAILKRSIVDKTGLTGKYAMTIQYTPDTGNAADSTDAKSPSIFNALQDQLGLNLISTKGPVKTLVIDHIEQPSPN